MNGKHCPRHEHEPRTAEGVAVLNTVLRHPGVLRRAGAEGAVVGLDLAAVLTACEARGVTDRAKVAELAGAAERGILAGQKEVLDHDRPHP